LANSGLIIRVRQGFAKLQYGAGKKRQNKGLKSMQKLIDIEDDWVVREEEIFGEFFCTGDGPWAYRYTAVKGIEISRIRATPMEKRSHK
jgi:hypothetical protein